MKKYLIIILIVSISLTLIGCSSKPTKQLEETIDKTTIENLSKTNKIIIKQNNEPNNIMGTITDTNTINEILTTIESSKLTGDVFNCDGFSFNFLMYEDDKLIDTIYIWTNYERLIPKSIHSGCSYYTISSNDNILKNIIEKNSDYIFYTIYDYSENCDTALELIYEDDKNQYYFDCIKSDKVFIEFKTKELKITLKEALNKKYIDISEIINTYPDLLIKKEK